MKQRWPAFIDNSAANREAGGEEDISDMCI
jgi:hypothetical protein